MNPLSPVVYYNRHITRLAALIALLTIIVAGIFLFISLAEQTYISPAYAINQYLDRFSLVQPELEDRIRPGIIDKIKSHSGVDKTIPQINIRIQVPNTGGAYFPFRIIGLKNEDIESVITECNVKLMQGSLPRPGTNEVVLSKEIAKSLKLNIGDVFDQMESEKLYRNIEKPLKLTGILEGDVRLGIMSYEFLDGNPVSKFEANGVLVISKEGFDDEVTAFLKSNIRDSYTRVYTSQSKNEDIINDRKLLLRLGIPVALILTISTTLVIGALNRLFYKERLPEFGILLSIGRTIPCLARRLTFELALPCLAGWVSGILAAWIVMAVLSSNFYAPGGFALEPFSLTAVPFVAAIPLSVIISTFYTSYRTLKKIDAISIIEDNDCSKERGRGKYRRSVLNLPIRPLSAITYYIRHISRALLAISVMVTMTASSASILVILFAGADAIKPALNSYSKVSVVTPGSGALDEKTVENLGDNPLVEKVIPMYDFSPFKISIPPVFPDHPIETCCVSGSDMRYLTKLYGLKLAEGHLPSPNTAEIVLPWSVAKNRAIEVGTVIGDPDHPLYANASALPFKAVVSGIFAPTDTLADETWLSFMSLEYVESYRISGLSLMLVPETGQKAQLDIWLKQTLSSSGTLLYTYENQKNAFQREMDSMLFTFLILECIITLVAALVLTGLSHSFLIQRKTELGILYALGFTRKKLIIRIMRENISIVVITCTIGIILCLSSLFAIQYWVYDRIGLKLNIFNPVPWLFMLPLPVTTLLFGTVSIIRTLVRLDPLDIIEWKR